MEDIMPKQKRIEPDYRPGIKSETPINWLLSIADTSDTFKAEYGIDLSIDVYPSAKVPGYTAVAVRARLDGAGWEEWNAFGEIGSVRFTQPRVAAVVWPSVDFTSFEHACYRAVMELTTSWLIWLDKCKILHEINNTPGAPSTDKLLPNPDSSPQTMP